MCGTYGSSLLDLSIESAKSDGFERKNVRLLSRVATDRLGGKVS